LDDYISRFKKGQNSLYFLGGTEKEIKESPFLEKLVGRGYEVIYMTEPIDEYMIQNMSEYEGKRFQNISKSGLKFGDEDEAENKKTKEELVEKYKPLAEWWQKLLEKDIDKVVVSDRLTTSPCAIVAVEWGWSANRQKLEAAQGEKNDPMSSFFANQKKTLEINPTHPVIMDFLKRMESPDVITENAAKVLYQTTLLRSGYELPSTASFVADIEKMVRAQLGVDLTAEATFELKPAEAKTPEDEAADAAKGDDAAPMDFNFDSMNFDDMAAGEDDELDLNAAADDTVEHDEL